LNCQYARLEQEALLHIIGPDTLKFLQGQTTCDTRKVDADHALPGVFCTPQGRVVCDFLLCELAPEHFALRMRRDIRAGSSAVFGKYIIFSKAKLDATREDWIAVAVWGSESGKALAELFGEAPTRRFDVTRGEGFVLVQLDDQGQQFECYLHSAKRQAHLAAMASVMQAGTESAWQALQIASGIARIEAATVEEFVPQILNYDLTGHISFNKGCYTGQEVVARLHYRGKPKRRTYVAELPLAASCSAGAPVFAANSDQSVGNIVNCCVANGKTHALVAATAGGVADGLHLDQPDGPPLKLGELPYPLATQA
jgi:folate-binding protein YgfZ